MSYLWYGWFIKTFAVVFSYEELNINVFLNSAMWNLKQKADIKFLAYTPKGFEKLFFAADEIIEIPQSVNSFRFYSEVSEYAVAQNQNFLPLVKQKVMSFCRSSTYRLFKAFKIRNQFLSSLLNLIPSDRARKFLFASGVWSWCKDDFELRVPSSDGGGGFSLLLTTCLFVKRTYV